MFGTLWKGGALALLALSIPVGIALTGSGGSGNEPPPPPVNTEFAGVLLRLGLSAETLSAAGISGAQVSTLVAAVRGQHNPSTLSSLDQAFIEAKGRHDRLTRLVRSGLGTQADRSALAQAETDLTSTTTARDNYLARLRSAGLATASPSLAAIVQAINANRSWGLPTQYLVKNRSEANWVALRDALATKRISEQDAEEDFPPATRSYLAVVDAEPEITAAKVLVDTNIAAVQTAWNTAATD